MRKVALVTGGAVRVGRALVLGLAEAGYDLVFTWHSSHGPAVETERRVRQLGGRVASIQIDVSRPSEIEELRLQVGSEFGRLDLLVNSAASFDSTPLLDVDDEAWDRVMAINLRAPFLVVRALASLLRESRGSVVNMVDLSAFQPWVSHPHHSVSKAGLLHMTRIMARTMAPHVRVNAIAPGNVLPPENQGEAERDADRAKTPVGHIGTPEDVVRTVLFLAGSPFITGEVIVVDGGRGLEG